mmetsp:Transcript_26001/g.61140  ORF Transcript_26001/g.61140 Transcript_26001/m.61140 type:complete len:290 (-) Transcript_26001:264-1133(-)
MMQSSNSLSFLLVLIGCALMVVDADLTPFYDFRSTSGDSKTNNVNTVDKNFNGSTEREPPSLRTRKLGGRYGRGRHHEREEYYDCESFYSKSHKSNKSSKSYKKEKHYKHSKKKCKNPSHKPGSGGDPKPPTQDQPYKEFMRFIMVREEAGTPVPDSFGVGDTLALNGKIYYWADYEDNLMSDVPVGTFVTLCTGISEDGDDLMCTYEIVLGLVADRHESANARNGNAGNTASPVESVGAFVASGPNTVTENYMIVTGTEFEFADFHSGTMVTTEDLVNPYLYADLYLA